MTGLVDLPARRCEILKVTEAPPNSMIGSDADDSRR